MTPRNGYTLTVFLLLLWGCAPQPPLTFTEAVTIAPNPNPAVPLAAVLRFAANRPVQTTIRVSDGTHDWELEYEESRKPEEGFPVVGMRPDRRHQIGVAIRDADGNEATAADGLEYTTPPLPTEPTEFPPIQVTVKKAGRMEPGITVFSPRRAVVGDLKASASFGMLAAIDADGEVVWYYRTDSRITDLQRLSNGNFMYITQDYRLVEIDLLGNVVSQWYATGRPLGPTDGTPVETLAFHHEVDELPSGNLVILGVENRQIDNYYTSEIDEKAPRKTQNVMGDQIIEFQRDGTETWRWQAFDNLDPLFIGFGNFSGYWVRRGFPDTVDWTHANGLLYDDADDSVLLNLRHLSAVVKIDRATSEIRWILAEPTGWPKELQSKLLKLEGDNSLWFHYQHAPVPTPHGTLLLFDNGVYKARPFDPKAPPSESFTRVVEYAIDEESMTARQVWASKQPGDDTVVTWAMGDVDWLPETGNVLAHYGATISSDQVEETRWESVLRTIYWSYIREYSHTTPAELVWEVVLEGNPEKKLGWSIYGGDRYPSLVP